MLTELESLRRHLTNGGFTCVVRTKDKEYTSFARGVKPLLELLHSESSFAGALAADKTIGAGAAHLYVLLGVGAVWANVISVSAEQILTQAGITVLYEERVPYIINRRGDGMCPIESAVANATSSKEAYALIVAALAKLS